MEAWHDFFVAQLGASSALTGLLFVAVSINLTRILEFDHLPIRAFECLVTLLGILIVSTWGLVPGQTNFAFGLEISLTGAALWLVLLSGLLRTRGSGYENWLRLSFNQIPPLPFVLAGVLMLLGWEWGIYLVVPGVLISTLAAVYNAWVLLIEIKR